MKSLTHFVFLSLAFALCARCENHDAYLSDPKTFPGLLNIGETITVYPSPRDKSRYCVFEVTANYMSSPEEVGTFGAIVEFRTDTGAQYSIFNDQGDLRNLKCGPNEMAGGTGEHQLHATEQAQAFQHMGLKIGCRRFRVLDLADLHCRRNLKTIRSITTFTKNTHLGTAKIWRLLAENKPPLYTSDAFAVRDQNNAPHNYKLLEGTDEYLEQARLQAAQLSFLPAQILMKQYLHQKSWLANRIHQVMLKITDCDNKLVKAISRFQQLDQTVNDNEYCDLYEAFLSLFTHSRSEMEKAAGYKDFFSSTEEIECCFLELPALRKRRR